MGIYTEESDKSYCTSKPGLPGELVVMITNVPAAWQKLEEQGITGAIDLAWYADAEDGELAGLAQRVGLDAHSLRDVAQRLSEDRQVQLLWVLYQGKSENEDGKGPESHASEREAA